MQKIVLEIEEDEVFEKVLWMLEHFAGEKLKVVYKKNIRKKSLDIKMNIDILKCKEILAEIESRDFSKIKTIKSLDEHFRELGI